MSGYYRLFTVHSLFRVPRVSHVPISRREFFSRHLRLSPIVSIGYLVQSQRSIVDQLFY